MNGKKLITLSALAAGLLALVAFAPAWADTATEGQEGQAWQEQQEHLWQMRNIMHYGVFTAQPTDSGVVVTVTGQEQGLVEAIRHEFTEQHTLASPVQGSQVAAAETEGGVALTFTAQEPAVVQALQGYGASLGYWILRDNMHATMWSFRGQQGYGRGWGMGPGHMMGPGYGPGAGRGYGPGGMMGPGYGPGMMGPGYGPGPR